MVLISTVLEPKAYQDFFAEIMILHHPTTISKGYQAMVHCGCIRQTATIINMNKDCLRTGDKAKVIFWFRISKKLEIFSKLISFLNQFKQVHLRFIKHAEYIRPNQNLVFREGKTKAIGKVLSVITDSTTGVTNTSYNGKKMKRMLNKKDEHETDENDLNSKNKIQSQSKSNRMK